MKLQWAVYRSLQVPGTLGPEVQIERTWLPRHNTTYARYHINPVNYRRAPSLASWNTFLLITKSLNQLSPGPGQLDIETMGPSLADPPIPANIRNN